MEKNFKWGPWKRGSDDRDYGPFVIQQYEREGTKDVGEFKDIPAYQSRFDVVDDQGGHHEFDSRSDAMKYAEKSFKEWKKMQKTKKNSIEQKKLAIIKSNAAPEVKLRALEILSNADSKLDPAKKALSGMLDQLGYKAMAREVMQESDVQALKKYSRVVISEFEKAKSPKLDRVKALLGQLGVGV